MILPNLVQGSPAWFNWRAGGIGGSDAATIYFAAEHSVSSWPPELEELLQAKLSPPEIKGDYPTHFRPREPSDAVQEFTRRTGIICRPACVQNDNVPWIRATLDGINFIGDGIVKCGPKKVLDHECALAGMVPSAWMPQVQHCLLASDAEVCWYVSWSVAKRFAEGQRWAMVEVLPDAEYMATLLTAGEEFWEKWQLAKAAGNLENTA